METRHKLYAILIVVSLLVTSCGGGGNNTDTGLTTPPPPPNNPTLPPPDGRTASLTLQGYGAKTSGGANGETCEVTTLIDSNTAGSLRYCIRNRNMSGTNYIPRKIVFTVGGELKLLTDLFIDTPFLTIDGSTAPTPGITITKQSITDGEMIISTTGPSSGHDIIIKHLRFNGEWDMVTESPPGANNSSTLAVDGEDEANAVYNIVLDHLTIHRATDSGPDFWGDIHDVTLQWCLIYDSIHPTTVSHSAGVQARKNFSFHHNIYAYNHERNPKIRGNSHDMDFRNNIIHQWTRFPGGYGIQLQDRNGVFPTDINFVNNYFYSDQRSNLALDYATTPYPGNVYLSGNRLTDNNTDSTGTTTTEIPVPAAAVVANYPLADLASQMLPNVGSQYRTAREQDIIDEIANIMANDSAI